MAYATRSDIQALYEQVLVDRICWQKQSNAVDYSKLDAGLANAATEIDAYLSTRYTVPVSPTPPVLKQMNVDLGLYYTAPSADKLFDQLQTRVDYWRTMLTNIARGYVGLGIPTSTDDGGSGSDTPPTGTGTQTGNFARAQRI
jgi:phage gp36-like protein